MSTVQISLLVLGGGGFIFSLLLALLSKKLKVGVDPRVNKILEILPGTNCGACGFSGCRVFAEAVAKEGKIFSGCLPGGNEINKKILSILEVEGQVVSEKKKVVVCRCGANQEEKKHSSIYSGPKTCIASDLIGGVIDCAYGCLGLGDCIYVCPMKAISLRDEKVYVDVEKCIGCGNCVKACPRNLFEFVPFNPALWYVACNNPEKAPNVKKVCGRGCIGCGICAKVKDSAFYIKDNLSYISYEKAKDDQPQKEAASKCPTKCILKTEDKGENAKKCYKTV